MKKLDKKKKERKDYFSSNSLILSFIPLTSFSRPSLYSFSNEILSSLVRKFLTRSTPIPQHPYPIQSPPCIPLSVIRYIAKGCIYIYRTSNMICMRELGGECCDMRGLLGFLILFLLSKKPMHGQEIANELAKRRGEKPSPGTIYPALKSLKDLGFLSEEKEGKTITYGLSAKGEKAFEIAKKRFTRTFLGIIT